MHRIDRLRRRPVATVAVAVTTIVLGLLFPSAAAATASSAVRTAVEQAACVVDVPGGARCGELSVPIVRGVADSPVATLPYVVVPAVLDTGRAPIVYLAGGVPLSSVDVTALAVDRGLAADRDVVFVERRGGADASPSLTCARAVDALEATFSAPTERATGVEAVSAAFAACATTWQEDGFTAGDFGVSQSAFDLRALREQLGYSRWTIMAIGTSAGIALAAPGIDPAGVDGIVLDGPDLGAPGIVSATGVAAGLSAVGARSATADRTVPTREVADAETDAAAASGTAGGAAAGETSTTERGDTADDGGTAEMPLDPVARSAEVLSDASAVLDRRPHQTGGTREITVGPDTLLLVASSALADATSQAALPYALESVAAGRRAALDALTARAYAAAVDGEPVLYRVLACSTLGWPGAAERTDTTTPAATTLLEDISAATCASLAIAPTPPPSVIGLPAIVITAPEQDAALAGPVAASLPNAISASFPGAGAVPTASSGCAVIAVRTWLAEPTAYRAALCAVDDAAVAVVHAGDVSASPRWVEQSSKEPGGIWLLLAIPLLFGVVAIGWAVAWAYRLIAQALRHDPVQAGLRLGIAPVFGASWAIAVGATLLRAADSSPATQLLGVPAALPWLSIVLLVSCIGLVPVWQGAHRGSRLRIAALSALWAATALWTAVFVLAWW